MIAILKQDGKHNRIFLYGKDPDRPFASFAAGEFRECYGQELTQKIWKERRVEIPEDNKNVGV